MSSIDLTLFWYHVTRWHVQTETRSGPFLDLTGYEAGMGVCGGGIGTDAGGVVSAPLQRLCARGDPAEQGGVAMRVNIDSKLWTDPRAKRLSALCSYSMRETVGTLAAVWDVAYAARSELMRRDDLELAAETPSFASHMVVARLATETSDPDVLRLAGVVERIQFLRLQAERGRAGGLAKARKRVRGVANAKQTPSERLANGKRTLSQPLTHSPAPSLPLPQAHALPEDHVTSVENTSVVPPGRRAERLPDNWVPARTEPNQRSESDARAAGVILRDELESMRDWAKAGGKTGKDWDARWRNWLREAARRVGRRGPTGVVSQGLLAMARGEES